VHLLDLDVLLAMAGAAIGGYRLGLLARATSWIGLAVGLYVGARFLPGAVGLVGDAADPTSRLLVAAAVLIGGAFIGQALGLVLGGRLRTALPIGPLRTGDRIAGGFIGALGVVVSVWLLLPAASVVQGDAARLARGSRVARTIDDVFPPAPDALQSLRSLVGDSGFPKVFEGLARAPEAGPPPAAVPIPADVLARVEASTVKVEGKACSRIQDGSGFVVSTDVVVTNAHVVAGEKGSTTVIRPDLSRVHAVVTVFDSDRDLAVLHAPGLGLRPVPLVTKTVAEGSVGAVLGHPGGQDPLARAPSKVSRRVEATGRDLYDRRQTKRDVFSTAAIVPPVYIGGPLRTPVGLIAGAAFAIAPDRDNVAYALTDAEVKAALQEDQAQEQSTGTCL
jgi:hypothetical protein